MAKFSATKAAHGTLAERVIDYPNETLADGSPLRVAVRVITGDERADILRKAFTYARGHGVQEPKRGDQIVELAVTYETIAVAVLDVDSPADKREPFFADSKETWSKVDDLTALYLFKHHELWQAECSPYAEDVDDAKLLDLCTKELAVTHPGFWLGLSQSTQYRSWRTAAALLVQVLEVSPEARSLLGALWPGSSPTETPAASDTLEVEPS